MTKLFRVMIALLVLAGGCMLSPLEVNFTADVGGRSYKALYATWEENASTSQIMAVDGNLKMFTISIPGVLEEGTYMLGLVGAEASAMYMDLLQQRMHVSQSGSLTIASKTSDGITGTFDMILTAIDLLDGGGTVEVMNGEFDLPSASDLEM